MARHKRYFRKNQRLHVIRRGNNRQAILFAPGTPNFELAVNL